MQKFFTATVILLLPAIVSAANDPAQEEHIRQTLYEAQAASEKGDIDKLNALLEFSTPDDKKAFLASIELLQVEKRSHESFKLLDEACVKKFGEHFMSFTVAPPATKPDPLSGAKITIDNDRAVVETTTMLPTGKPFTAKRELVRRNNTWKLIASGVLVRNPAVTQGVAEIEKTLGEAYAVTAADIQAGKFATIADVRQGFQDNLARATTKAAAAKPHKPPTPLTIDLTKSHTLGDAHWTQPSMPFATPASKDDTFDLTLKLPGLNPVTVLTAQPEVGRRFGGPGKVSLDEPLISLNIKLKKPLKAEEVRKLAKDMGVSAEFQQQLAAWPTEHTKTTEFQFEQPMPDTGALHFFLDNDRKFTGEIDSWRVTIQAAYFHVKKH